MGTGYNWMEPTNLGPLREQLGSYLTTQVGQPSAPYTGQLTPSIPNVFGDIGNIYSYLLSSLGAPQTTGQGTPMPPGGVPPSGPMAWGAGTLKDLLATGLPSLKPEQKEAARLKMEQDLEREISQRMESRHLTGGRYSSGAQHQIGRATGEAMVGYGSEMARLEAEMAEAASNRRLAALGMTPSFYGAMYNVPLNVLGAAEKFGTTQYGMEGAGLSASYQEWLRQQPQYNPNLALALQYATSSPGMFAQNPWLALLSGGVQGASAMGAAALSPRPGG